MMLCKGCPPWAPTSDTSDVDDFLYYDHPLIGTFVSGGNTYLFDCLVGQGQRLAMWTYTLLTPAEVASLDELEFDGAEEIATWAFRLSRHRAKTVALSWRDKIRMHADTDADTDMFGCLDMLMKMFEAETESMTFASPEITRRNEAAHLVQEQRRELVDA